MSGTDAVGDGEAGGNGSTPSVLVTDRGRAFAQALAGLLNAAGCAATSAPFPDAADLCRALRPATLLLDGDPPTEDAREIAAAARATLDDLRVVLLVATGGRIRSRAVAELRADGVVSRQSGVDEVLQAIQGVPNRASNGHRSRREPRSTSNGNPVDRLTPREREVLQALMAGGGSAAIAQALGISPHTVRTHVQNTFAKLAVSTRLEAASVARDAGLRPLDLDAAHMGGTR